MSTPTREIAGINFPGRIPRSPSLVELQRQMERIGGLVNMGLTCYANAVIQSFRHCAKIPWIFEEGRYSTLMQEDATGKRKLQQPVTKAFAEVIQLLQRCKKGQSVRPGEFWRTIPPCVNDTTYEHFAVKAPHDSHEFYLFLLDTLHESLSQEVDMKILRPPPQNEAEKHVIQALETWKREFSKMYSPLVDLFYGLLHVQVRCNACSAVSHRWESFNTLKGVVPTQLSEGKLPTLHEMLHEEWKPETISDYVCDRCAPKRTEATRSVSIWRLPQYLVIVLKRFTPDGRKIHTRLAPLEPVLSLESHFSSESPEREGKTDYTLRAIVDHHGSAGGGHYTAQGKHLQEETWMLYDDESVTALPHPMVGESTYMLFFERAGGVASS